MADQPDGQPDAAGDREDLDDDREDGVGAAGLLRPLGDDVDGVVVDRPEGERRVPVVHGEHEGGHPRLPAQHAGDELVHARRVLALERHHELGDEGDDPLRDAEEDQDDDVRDDGEELDQKIVSTAQRRELRSG